jgi:polyhydroxyalkanoate synthase
MTWTGSNTVLPFWNDAWRHLNPEKNPDLAAEADAIGRVLKQAQGQAQGQAQEQAQKQANEKPNQNRQADAHATSPDSGAPDAFADAVNLEARRRLDQFHRGLTAYRHHPYRRPETPRPAIWTSGSARLIDYRMSSAKAGRPVLFVPSLVNRGYVLDLMEGRSLLEWLASDTSTGTKQSANFRPLALEWGAPDDNERKFTLTDFVTERLEPALDRAADIAGGPVPVVGYCMGGLLAVALAQRQPDKVSHLALLATPWDFHAGDQGAEIASSAANAASAWAPWIDLFGELPVDGLQSLFAMLDPFLVMRKFRAFADLNPTSERAKVFVALEDWLNDGVPLAGPVALECLNGWYRDNAPAMGHWRIGGTPVDPATLDMPTLLVIPQADRIVPPKSALALARSIPHAQTLRPKLGHIGMVTSARAKKAVWMPLADWLDAPKQRPKTTPQNKS